MYSLDFRKQALQALKHRSFRQVAKDFGVSPVTIQRWRRELTPKPQGERRSKISLEALKKDVEMYPDAYQHERAERFNCKQSSICNRLKKLKISKKNSPTPESFS